MKVEPPASRINPHAVLLHLESKDVMFSVGLFENDAQQPVKAYIHLVGHECEYTRQVKESLSDLHIESSIKV